MPKLTKGHQHLLLDALPTEIKSWKSDNHVTSVDWEQNYIVKIGDGKDISPRDWTCYTDGSRTNGRAGSGGRILYQGRYFENVSFSVGQAEVFQAEVCAISACARRLIVQGVMDSKIDFLVDSQPALRAIAKIDTISDTVRNAKKILNVLGYNNEVVLQYIEAHKGWENNEHADKLAKQGAFLEEVAENVPPPSKRSLNSSIESMIRGEWELIWESLPHSRQTKYFIGGPSKMRAKLLLQNPRDCLGRLVRFLTGHAFLRRQNAIVSTGLDPPPGDISCRLCKDPFSDETPHHIIIECDVLCRWRAQTLSAYVLDEFPQWDVQSLTKFLSLETIILLETE